MASNVARLNTTDRCIASRLSSARSAIRSLPVYVAGVLQASCVRVSLSLTHTHNRTSKCAWQPRNSLTMACAIRVPCASLRSEVPSQSINHSSLTMCRGTAALTRENRVEMECVLPLYTRQGEILVRIGTAKSDSVVLFSGHPTLIYSYRTRSFQPTNQPTTSLVLNGARIASCTPSVLLRPEATSIIRSADSAALARTLPRVHHVGVARSRRAEHGTDLHAGRRARSWRLFRLAPTTLAAAPQAGRESRGSDRVLGIVCAQHCRFGHRTDNEPVMASPHRLTHCTKSRGTIRHTRAGEYIHIHSFTRSSSSSSPRISYKNSEQQQQSIKCKIRNETK